MALASQADNDGRALIATIWRLVVVFNVIFLINSKCNRWQSLSRCKQYKLGAINFGALFKSVSLLFIFISIIFTCLLQYVQCVAPTIDYSHNMRVLKLPKSTQPGELIYRLKGSDGDAHSQLMFGVSGIEARQLLDVLPVPKSWNEADVYLKSPLEASHYNLSIFVSDGNKTTTVDSTILVIADSDIEPGENIGPTDQYQLDAGSITVSDNQTSDHHHHNHHYQANPTLSPFVRPTKQVFSVPENSEPGESIGLVSVRESSTSELPVRFELRGKGSDKFAIKYDFGPRGQSRGQIQLTQRLDYEQQNVYALKVLALNAWTNIRLDTRNVATLDIMITVQDVQDTAPIWAPNTPRLLVVNNKQEAGELVAKLEAVDGDFADPRPLGYALDAGSWLANYFDIDKTDGGIKLRRPASELISALGTHQNELQQQFLVVFASELPDTSSYEHLWPPMFARLELPLVIVDTINEAPQFYGGMQSNESLRLGGQRILHGYLNELVDFDSNESNGLASNYQTQHQIQWFTNSSQANMIADETIRQLVVEKAHGRPVAIDLGQAANGTFELKLDGQHAALFQVEPSFPVHGQTMINIRVAPGVNRSLFDRDLYANEQTKMFQFELIARDFGPAERLETRIKCQIELLDLNDNAPVFERDIYTMQVYESAPPGQLLGSIRAHDKDSRGLERINYASLSGKDAHLFRLDQDSGLITLAGTLDREKQSQYLLLAEARDPMGVSNFTKILINVLDVNDNAPEFVQSHYDALLHADGTFESALVVHARDADEPNSANSQLAYEIIAGNQNNFFAIDSLSGQIYLAGAGRPLSVPGLINEPIIPFGRPLESAGKILPTVAGGGTNREIEETTPRQQAAPPLRLAWPPVRRHQQATETTATSNEESPRAGRIIAPPPPPLLDLNEQMPALGLLLNLEDSSASDQIGPISGRSLVEQAPPVGRTRSGSNNGATNTSTQLVAHFGGASRAATSPDTAGRVSFDPLKLAPVTTLVVRAHDFGIPIRSATCKVNIYNQAIQSRSISIILNGTAEQLAERRDAIERTFGALTGTRARIESLDALSDSSSLSVARVQLLVPSGHHQLVDLTDLSAFIQALDYKLPNSEQQQQQRHTPTQTPTYIVPIQSSNLSAPNQAGGLYTDSHINQTAFDAGMLEKKLLIYIIIVGVCILALLIIWMIYSCCHEDKVKLVERSSSSHYRSRNVGTNKAVQSAGNNSTEAKQVATQHGSPIGNNLAKHNRRQQACMDAESFSNNNRLQTGRSRHKSDHLSMYNGQVWFEPGGQTSAIGDHHSLTTPGGSALIRTNTNGERRASLSNSLDSALRTAINADPSAEHHSATLMPGGAGQSTRRPVAATGQFFPNAQAYVDNLDSIEASKSKRTGRTKVAPMDSSGVPIELGKQVASLAAGSRHQRAADKNGHSKLSSRPRQDHTTTTTTTTTSSTTRSCSSSSSSSESTASTSLRRSQNGRRRDSVILDSDQELLGFDSTGTPIIATHTSAIKQPTIDGVLMDADTAPKRHRQMFKAPAGATSYIVPLTGETVMTHEQMEQATSGKQADLANRIIRPEVSEAKQKHDMLVVGQQQSNGTTTTAATNPATKDGAIELDKRDEVAQNETNKQQQTAMSSNKQEESEEQQSKEQTELDEQKPIKGRDDNNNQFVQTTKSELLKPGSTNKNLSIIGELNERFSATNSEKRQHAQEAERKLADTDKVGLGEISQDATKASENNQSLSMESAQNDDRKNVDNQNSNDRHDERLPELTRQLNTNSKSISGSGANGSAQRPKPKLQQQQRTMSEDSTMSLNSMQNRELLGKQSIFAMTYSGIATDKLPI